MTKKQLTEEMEAIVESTINDLFGTAQDKVGATSGDIFPDQHVETEQLQERLLKMIVDVAWQNRKDA